MNAKHHALRYRPDIDGLRAIAVVAVVLFHANVPYFTGGFVGVDVFFVLSGFLITSMLIEDNSIVRFYQRRARRILPALFFMLATVGVLGLVLFLPTDYVNLAESMAATLAFASNLWFWRQADYFATGTELWPLLHTWSLGVEEQFYIAFPILVKLASRLRRGGLAVLFTAVGIVSLALAALLMMIGKDTFAFYQFPSRAWELLVGSVLATGAIPPLKHRRIRSAVALGGLAAIVLPVALYNAGTTFPGIGALPPVLGTAAVIWAGTGNSHVLSAPLSWRPVVFIGLISYSLYLWHWPALAFTHYVVIRPLTPLEATAAVGVAFVAAVVSWRFVERPFRRSTMLDRTVWLSVLGGATALTTIVIASLTSAGFPSRFPPDLVALNERPPGWRCGMTDFVLFGNYYACPINLPSRDVADADVVLWGDSHAEMYVPALQGALGDRRGLMVISYGCAPTVVETPFPGCGEVQQANFSEIVKLPASIVVLAQNWPQYRDEAGSRLGRTPLPAERYQDGLRRLEQTVTALREAGKRVVVVGPLAVPGEDLASVLPRAYLFGRDPGLETHVSRAGYLEEYDNVLVALAEIDAKPGVEIVRVDTLACDATNCDFLKDGRPVFADYGHLARATAEGFAPLFRTALDTVAASNPSAP
jgi:peptidoglycan/LPS O-acetylase OafA/YrhL